MRQRTQPSGAPRGEIFAIFKQAVRQKHRKYRGAVAFRVIEERNRACKTRRVSKRLYDVRVLRVVARCMG